MPRCWSRATEVCNYWRTVAINDPILWTKLDWPLRVYSPFQVELLKRASSAPIDLRMTCYNANPCVLRELQSRCGQFRDLELSCFTTPDISHIFPDRAPMLRSLTVDHISLPELFQGCMPRLATLELIDVTTYSPRNDFSNLTTLIIDASEPWSQEDYENFLIFLGSCPRLQQLEMTCRADPEESDVTASVVYTPPHLIVELPLLRRLDVLYWHITLPAALLCLDSLPKENLAITVRDCWPAHPAIEDVILSFWADSKSRPCPDATRMDIDFTPVSIYVASTTSSITMLSELCDQEALDFKPSGLSGTARLIMSYNLTELWLAGFSLNPIEEWPVIFSALPSLDKLGLEISAFDSPGPWFDALCPADGLQGNAYPAPALRELWLSPFDWDPDNDILLKRLAWRRDSGHGIHTLHIMYAPADKPPRNEYFKYIFYQWQEIRQELESVVDVLTFETYPKYPTMARLDT